VYELNNLNGIKINTKGVKQFGQCYWESPLFNERVSIV